MARKRSKATRKPRKASSQKQDEVQPEEDDENPANAVDVEDIDFFTAG
jgi:hypothetical protein